MDEVVNVCVKKFNERLEDEDSELSAAFEQTLKEKYEELKMMLNAFNGGDLSQLNSMLMEYAARVTLKPIKEKRQILIKDYSFIRLQALADEACQMAICVVNGKMQNENKEKEIIYAKELYEKVRDFNKERARIVLSNIIMDLEYVSGKGSNTSVKVGMEIIKKELDSGKKSSNSEVEI